MATRPIRIKKKSGKKRSRKKETNRQHGQENEQGRKRKKKKRKRKRVVPIVPGPVGPPWSDNELDAIVERAILYIAEARRRWGTTFGMAVGEWLYRELYLMDDGYLRSKDPRKKKSLYDIARRTGTNPRTLRTWVWAARMKHRLGEQGFRSESLMLTDWAALYPLRDRPLAARQVAEWVHNDNPTVEEVQENVRIWDEHMRNPPKRRKKKKNGRKRRKRPYEQRLLCTTRLMHRWVCEVKLSRHLGERLLVQVRQVRALIEGGGGA